MTPNTAMQTAVMWGYASCSVAVYKYGASVVEHYRYAPPDPPPHPPRPPGAADYFTTQCARSQKEHYVLSEHRGALALMNAAHLGIY